MNNDWNAPQSETENTPRRTAADHRDDGDQAANFSIAGVEVVKTYNENTEIKKFCLSENQMPTQWNGIVAMP